VELVAHGHRGRRGDGGPDRGRLVIAATRRDRRGGGGRHVERTARGRAEATRARDQRVPGARLVDARVVERGDAAHRVTGGAGQRAAARVRSDRERDPGRRGGAPVAELIARLVLYGRGDVRPVVVGACLDEEGGL